jgi:hypothetical protein
MCAGQGASNETLPGPRFGTGAGVRAALSTAPAVGCCKPYASVAAWDAGTGRQLFRERLPAHAAAIAFSPTPGSWASAPPRATCCWGALATAGGDPRDLLLARRPPVRGDRVRPDGNPLGSPVAQTNRQLRSQSSREPSPSRCSSPTAGCCSPISQTAWNGPSTCTAGSAPPAASRGRDLTRNEWNDLLPNRPYRRVCR